MKNITEHIKNRRSVRSFDGKGLNKADLDSLMTFAKTIENPYKIPVGFKIPDARQYGLSCPVTVGTDLFIGGSLMMQFISTSNAVKALIITKSSICR